MKPIDNEIKEILKEYTADKCGFEISDQEFEIESKKWRLPWCISVIGMFLLCVGAFIST